MTQDLEEIKDSQKSEERWRKEKFWFLSESERRVRDILLLLPPNISFSITLTTQTQEGRLSLPSIANTDTGQEGGKYLMTKLWAERTSGRPSCPSLESSQRVFACIYSRILEDRSEGRWTRKYFSLMYFSNFQQIYFVVLLWRQAMSILIIQIVIFTLPALIDFLSWEINHNLQVFRQSTVDTKMLD